MKRNEAATLFLAGMIAATLLIMACQQSGGTAHAADGGGTMGASSGGVIALTNSDKSGLYLIHPEYKHIAFYQFDAGKLFLRGTRTYKHDVYLPDANGRINVRQAKELHEKETEKDAK